MQHVVRCGGKVDGAGVCTAKVCWSVVVTIVDAAGAPLSSATVSWRVDGGPPQAVACIGVPAGCIAFFVGEGASGEFTIAAEKSGSRPAMATVTVRRDLAGPGDGLRIETSLREQQMKTLWRNAVIAALWLGLAVGAARTQLSDTEQRIVAAVKLRSPAALALLEKSVRINSVNFNTAGVRAASEVFRA